jgi:hypothetical protein
MTQPTAIEVVRRRREDARLREEIALLRTLVESMALGLTVDEMPENEAALLNEILDRI